MQSLLIPLTDTEKLRRVAKTLSERGKHTMYCGWNGQYYDKRLGCTCGLNDALELCADVLKGKE